MVRYITVVVSVKHKKEHQNTIYFLCRYFSRKLVLGKRKPNPSLSLTLYAASLANSIVCN